MIDSLHWQELLQARKKTLLTNEGQLIRRARTELGPDGSGELSRTRWHPADSASETQEMETLDSLSKRNIKSVQEIDEALRRLETGTYGVCENCSEAIAIERLELVPEARYCVSCEKEIEKARREMINDKHLRRRLI